MVICRKNINHCIFLKKEIRNWKQSTNGKLNATLESLEPQRFELNKNRTDPETRKSKQINKGKFSLLEQFIYWIKQTLLDMDVTWSYILINRFQNLLSCSLSFAANNRIKCMKV